ncbi:MAG: RagB/SusD family nutrient uptake outer membrane protein [Bacteroidales bacterium]|nr:RagB/SusD family nutrient uptake outer membrane protein [Bacteroidales bacterium]
MKTIKYIFCFAVLAMCFVSCKKDLLDTAPYSAVSSKNIWNSANLATQAVTGMYNVLLQNSGTSYTNSVDGANYLGLDAHTMSGLDPTVSPRNNWSSTFPLLNGNATPSSGMFSLAWKQLYEGIARTNDVIANIGSVPDMEDALKNRYIAEAKFLRAYFYYRLNCFYRGVPIYLEPTEVSEMTKPRNTESEVWAAILADLTDAINESNLPDRYEAGDSNYGHVTKGAAYALRGKVYMWTKEYDKAVTDLTNVTTMGYSLFQGEYKQLFKEENEQCPEMIFSIQCYELNTYGNQMTFKYGSRMTRGSCWDDFFGDADFIDTYETVDGKEFNWDDFIPGYTSMTPKERSVYFLRDAAGADGGMDPDGKYYKQMVNYGSDMSKYLPEGNEARIKAVYESRDPRLMQTYITPYSEYLGSPSGTPVTVTLRWPYLGDNTSKYSDLRSDDNSKYRYLVRKFVSEGNELEYRQYSPIDVPIIRYADVLLTLAEALNETGKTNEATTYVNMVRKRVGIAALNSNSYTTVTGQENLRQRIRREKRWELACEGVLYFDELRWGTWCDVKTPAGSGIKECWGVVNVGWTPAANHYMTWPIPATERQLNTSLTQNPGWAD